MTTLNINSEQRGARGTAEDVALAGNSRRWSRRNTPHLAAGITGRRLESPRARHSFKLYYRPFTKTLPSVPSPPRPVPRGPLPLTLREPVGSSTRAAPPPAPVLISLQFSYSTLARVVVPRSTASQHPPHAPSLETLPYISQSKTKAKR